MVSQGSGKCEALCTKVVRPAAQDSRIEDYQDVDTVKTPLYQPSEKVSLPAVTSKSTMIKKRKFSFRHGKMSITEEPGDQGDPRNIYLEVEGQEIEVTEDCLVSNCQHFTRVLEDISVNNKSEFLMTGEEEDEDCDEDDSFSTLSYETVNSVIDYIAAKVSDLGLSCDMISPLRLL